MKRLVVLLAATALVGASPTLARAEGTTMVRGGGTGTFGVDLDENGTVDGSQFGMNVTIFGHGSATGRFLCLMSGRSQILELSVMSVAGPVTTGTAGSGTATFGGTAAVNLGGGTVFRGVPFLVTVTGGGPGAGTLQLTVVGAFDGVPGDTITGNGNYDLPVETVASGRIDVVASS